MLEVNKVYLCDVMDGLNKLDDNSVDLLIFSPPYNKKGFLGKKAHKYVEGGLWNDVIVYDNFDDDLPEDFYKAQQIALLNECARVLKPNGSVFYQHKIRVRSGIASNPYEWISQSDLLFRQLIIWNRGGSVSLNKDRFLPTTEQVFWLTKDNKNVRFLRQGTTTEVWNIAPDIFNGHPAPYPLELPLTIIRNVLGDAAMQKKMGKLLVVDPFMGSGTTGVAAVKAGCDFIGFDMSPKYVNMATKRIAQAAAEMDDSIWDNI